MKCVCVRKSDMSVIDILDEEPIFPAFGSAIRAKFYFFDEANELDVQVGYTCSIDGDTRTYETP